MESDVREDAVDVLRDALAWRLAEGRWVTVGRVVDTMAAALAAGDDETFREAVYDLELAGPVRADIPRDPPPASTPDTVRERINVLIHTLDGQERQAADDGDTSAPS